MSQRQTKFTCGMLFLVAGLSGIAILRSGLADKSTATETVSKQPETLLPAGTILYVQHDGDMKHQRTWKQTAAYASMYETGLVDIADKLFRYLLQRVGSRYNPKLETLVRHISNNGFSLSISLPSGQGPPLPNMTLVLHNASTFEKTVNDLAKFFGGRRMNLQTKTVGSRKVTSGSIPNTPGVEIGWWVETNHLVIVTGLNVIGSAVSVAAGDTPNVTSNELWKTYRPGDDEFDVVKVGWLDVAKIRKTVGQIAIPVPKSKPVTIIQGLETLGLDNIETIVWRSGYKGKALWSTTDLKTTGELKGLLSLSKQRAITFDDLPPLPVNTKNFYAGTLDPSRLFDDLLQVAKDVSALGPSQTAAQVEGVISALPQILGFDVKADLLGALGDVHCVYGDPDQGFFGSGSGLVLQVRDADKLRITIDGVLNRLSETAGKNFKVHRVKKHGREILTFEFGQHVEVGAMTIDKNWIVFGFLPQSVEAFLLRVDGKLASLSLDDLQKQGVSELPDRFTSLSVNDPRLSYHALLKLAPVALTAGITALKAERILPLDAELPISLTDIPPAELVVKPLFPNVTYSKLSEHGIRWTSRSSVPGIPIISGIGGGNTLATGSVAIALLLPAVQQAREAARRTQSRNNLKQMGLALHNYHDVNGSFPAGTYPNEKLKPKERLSWFSRILPYMDQALLYEMIDFEGGWEDKENEKHMKTNLRFLMNPGITQASKSKYGETHYVGIAGVGKDAPTLPKTSKRAGVFSYNRKTRFRNITDGSSNTMMVSEASKDFGPWGAGGKPTIRALTKKPYINGPDGIGGPFKGGCNVLFCDGSVRFISKNIDPKVFEAISTMAGGEVVGAF